MIVVRVASDGSLTNAKPCRMCLEFIKQVGIKIVYYSTESGILKMNPRETNLEECCVSKGVQSVAKYYPEHHRSEIRKIRNRLISKK